MATFGQDLFVSLSVNKYAQVLEHLEQRVGEFFDCRHEYPLWPIHGGNPSDRYEEEYHGRIRHSYYDITLELVRILRKLRNLS